jgi:hypothetical protein
MTTPQTPPQALEYAVKWVHNTDSGYPSILEEAESREEALQRIENESNNGYSPWYGVLVARPAPQPWTEVTDNG